MDAISQCGACALRWQALAQLHLPPRRILARRRASCSRWLLVSPSSLRPILRQRCNDISLLARPLAGHKVVRDCADEALELLAPFHAELAPLLPNLSTLWTHNDLHGSNLFWSDTSDRARATAIIDFGLADRTNVVHDIAHAIERNIVEWLVLVR